MSKGLFAVVRSPYGFESVPPSSEAWLVKSCAQLPSLIPAAGARWLNGAGGGGWHGRGILAQVVPATARVVRAQQPRDVDLVWCGDAIGSTWNPGAQSEETNRYRYVPKAKKLAPRPPKGTALRPPPSPPCPGLPSSVAIAKRTRHPRFPGLATESSRLGRL